MKQYKPYKNYKDSDIDWLGKIPEHWFATRLSSVFNERREKVSDKDFAPLSVTKNGIVPQLENAAKSNDGDNRKGVRKGDFVINSRSDRKGSSGIAKGDGSVSLINTVLKPNGIVPEYSEYLLKNYYFKEEFYRFGHGIVADLWTTKYADMKSMEIPIPPKTEQQAIADFLDKKTVEIKQFIRLKEKTIALLKEQKAAIINQAVTKGINPNIKLKDSGIEWLGKIPEHWEVKKLKHCCLKITDGSHFSPKIEEYGIPYITVSNIGDNTINLKDSKRISKESYLLLKKNGCQPYPNDILITKDGTIGRAAVVKTDDEFVILSSLGLITPSPKFIPDYLRHILISYVSVQQMKSKIQGSAITRLTISLLNNLSIVVTNSYDEQKKIITLIDSKCSIINKKINKIKKEIKLIKEYQQSLISAAVTGKIDVRENIID